MARGPSADKSEIVSDSQKNIYYKSFLYIKALRKFRKVPRGFRILFIINLGHKTVLKKYEKRIKVERSRTRHLVHGLTAVCHIDLASFFPTSMSPPTKTQARTKLKTKAEISGEDKRRRHAEAQYRYRTR